MTKNGNTMNNNEELIEKARTIARNSSISVPEHAAMLRELADALEAASQTRTIEPMEADELEAIRDALMIDLTKTGYDLSGTDHSYENEIEVGTNEHEFRITIGGI